MGLPSGISTRTAFMEHISERSFIYNLDSGLSMYADDHQIYVKGKDMCTIVEKLLINRVHATLATRVV